MHKAALHSAAPRTATTNTHVSIAKATTAFEPWHNSASFQATSCPYPFTANTNTTNISPPLYALPYVLQSFAIGPCLRPSNHTSLAHPFAHISRLNHPKSTQHSTQPVSCTKTGKHVPLTMHHTTRSYQMS